MICSKCGKEINDESIICNFCGNKIKRKRPFFKNKKKLIIVGGSFLFVLISVVVIIFLIIPANTLAAFSSENQSGNYQNAYVLFKNTCDSNSINSGIIKSQMLDQISKGVNKNIEDYRNGSIDDESIIEYIAEINDYYGTLTDAQVNDLYGAMCDKYKNNTIDLTRLVSNYNEIKKIHPNPIDEKLIYETYLDISNKYLEKDNFKTDVINYITVFKIDKNNEVLKAQIEKVELINKQRSNFANAEKYFSDGDYVNAYKNYSYVDANDTLYYDTATSKMEDSFNKVNLNALTAIKQFQSNGEYEKALDYANSITSFIKDNSEINTILNKCKDNYKNIVLQNVDDYMRNNSFDIAVAELEKLKKFVNDSDVAKKYNECINKYDQYKVTRIHYLKGKVTIKYDDIDKKYTIVPKGYSIKYINISKKINIEPRMIHENSTNSLQCFIGFVQRDWIFFQSIDFYYDGNTKSWTIDYFDRQDQVIWGGIVEWYTVVYSKTNFLGVARLRVDLLDIMRNLANGKDSRIRFSGQGSRDHKLTGSEKNNLKNFIELYNLLESSPDLWNILIE